jgi:hypothetical protein
METVHVLSKPGQGILMVLAVIGAILLSPVLLVIAFIYLVWVTLHIHISNIEEHC